MTPYYQSESVTLYNGDCLTVMRTLADCSIDSIVTDPPYFLTNENGNGFMGKAWDSLSLSNAIVDALFRSARLVLTTDEVNTAPAPVNTTQRESETSRIGDAPCAGQNSIAARRTLNQQSNSAQETVITKQEALVLCGVLSPVHTIYLQSLPTSARFVMSDLSTVLSGKSIARKLAAILLDDPAWLAQITTFTSTGKTANSVIEASNGNSSASKSTSAMGIHASDVESIVGQKRFSATTSSLTTFQEIIAKIISSPSATRAIRLCTSDRSLIPVLSEVFHRRWSREAFRVLKPGAHLLAFAGTRTYHRLVSALEDEGFEIRDQIQWLYGSGFPKSLDVSKAIDATNAHTSEAIERLKDELRRAFDLSGLTLSVLNERCGFEASGYLRKSSTWTSVLPTADKWWKIRQVIGCNDALSVEFKAIEREVVGLSPWTNSANHFVPGEDHTQRLRLTVTAPTTDAAKQWKGWGTALKPACEDWWLCRKPLEGTVAQNVLKHGTGGLNIDGCRITVTADDDVHIKNPHTKNQAGGWAIGKKHEDLTPYDPAQGRWPANVTTDGSEEVLAGFPETESVGHHPAKRNGLSMWSGAGGGLNGNSGAESWTDSGSAARFFYCAKSSQQDRNEGLEDLELLSAGVVTDRKDGSAGLNSPRAGAGRNSGSRNHHPTVKPLALMRYLVRLITPPDGLILDPFCGSGSTGKAAVFEDFRFIGIELSEDYCKLAQRRIESASKQNQFKQGELFTTASDYSKDRSVETVIEQEGLFALAASE